MRFSKRARLRGWEIPLKKGGNRPRTACSVNKSLATSWDKFRFGDMIEYFVWIYFHRNLCYKYAFFAHLNRHLKKNKRGGPGGGQEKSLEHDDHFLPRTLQVTHHRNFFHFFRFSLDTHPHFFRCFDFFLLDLETHPYFNDFKKCFNKYILINSYKKSV